MRLVLPIAVALLAACVPPTFPEDRLPLYEERPVQGNFRAEFAAVWDAAMRVVSGRYPVALVDRAHGLIATEWVTGPSDYIYSTFARTRIPERVRFRMRMEIRDWNGLVEVRLVSHEQVEKDVVFANLPLDGSLYEWFDVPSSTLKERAVLQEILDVLEGRPQGEGHDG